MLGLLKDNTGYDLKHLFMGSEGTLGFIVDAKINLVPLPAQKSVMTIELVPGLTFKVLLALMSGRNTGMRLLACSYCNRKIRVTT